MRRWCTAGVAVVALLAAACGASDGGGDGGGAAAGLTATPSSDCAPDHGLYDGLRAHLAEEAAAEDWIDRVAVCAGGTIEVDQADLTEAQARAEALEVCEVAAGYLLTNPPPPERADAPNPKELGVIVADAHGNPLVLGAEEEAPAGEGDEAAREEREREEREREAAAEGDAAGRGSEREAEPHRCFAPFA